MILNIPLDTDELNIIIYALSLVGDSIDRDDLSDLTCEHEAITKLVYDIGDLDNFIKSLEKFTP